jgi:hypothetical protein
LHSPDSPLTALSAAQPGLGKIADDGGDRALPFVGVVQVDQRGPGAGMAHACHQFAQARPGCRGQDVAGMAQVVEVDLGQARFGERGQRTDRPGRGGNGCVTAMTLCKRRASM